MLRDSYHIGGNSMIKLYEEFNDLYKLHRAAVELKHGIYSRGWRLFEPSKFIYSFFAFNSFYSINWRESQIQGNLKYKKS